MRKSLVKYSRKLPTRSSGMSTGTIVGVAIIALIIYLLLKRRFNLTSGQYSNKEEWDVQYSADGLPTKITIIRNATRS